MTAELRTKTLSALNVVSKALGQEPIKNSGEDAQGRNYMHWSYYLLVTGAIIGAAAAIAAAIIGITTLIVSGTLLFATNAIGAYYIARFDTYNDLEDYADILAQKVQQLADHVRRYDDQNDRYEVMNEERTYQIEQFGEINKDTEKLNTERESSMVNGHHQLMQELSQFSEETGKWQQQQQGMAVLNEQLNKRIEELAAEISAFIASGQRLDGRANEIGGYVQELEGLKKALRRYVKKQDQIKKQSCSETKKAVKLLNELLDAMNKQNYNETLEQMEGVQKDFRQTTRELQQAVDEFSRYGQGQNAFVVQQVSQAMSRFLKVANTLAQR